jgi:hypothetical protein
MERSGLTWYTQQTNTGTMEKAGNTANISTTPPVSGQTGVKESVPTKSV